MYLPLPGCVALPGSDNMVLMRLLQIGAKDLTVGMASPLQTSFSCTKDAQDKHNVPASRNKVFSLSDIHLSPT